VSSELKLRDYQEHMIEEAREAARKGSRGLLMYLPTGGGKTQLAIAMMRSAWEKGFRTIFFAHRRQLVEQTLRRFQGYGVDATVIMDGYEFDPSKRLVIASYQTWESRKDYLDREYTLVFFDEAHIGVDRQRRIINDIRETVPRAIAVGLTATPMTNSGPGLGAVYDTLIHGPSIAELQQRGFLVPAEYYLMQPLDWRAEQEIKINSAGEYDERDVMRWFREKAIMGDVIQNWIDNFMGEPTIVFARSVEQSLYIAESFGKRGIPAAHIDYRTPDKVRHEILSGFRDGRISILSNVSIFTEGFDMPDIRVAIIATPVRSLQRYIQMVGRALRPSEDKESAIIVDHGGVLQEHGRVEDYLEWALEPARPDRSVRAHAVKRVATQHMRKCPICKTEFKPGPKECPNCGYDFHRLPPGYEPPVIPATMVEYQEAKAMLKAGKRKKCSPYTSIYGMDKKQVLEELAHLCAVRGYKPGFARALYYSATCRCAPWFRFNPDELIQRYGNEPTPLALEIMKRYWTMKKYGYFKEYANECLSSN